jgi:regulator of sigma E protease
MQFLYHPAFAALMASSLTEWVRKPIIYVGAVVFVLGVLVFVHEFGHYAVAKLFNVRVEVFSLGFGKRIWGFRRGDTDYRISLLPLGGYVKMAGENPMEQRTGDPGEFMSHPRWQRFLIAIAGPVMNIILAVVVLSAVYRIHHEFPAVMHAPVDVLWIQPGSPAEKAGLQKGDRIVQVQDAQNPNWEQFLTREVISPKDPLELTVSRDGQLRKVSVTPEAKGPSHAGDIGLRLPAVVGTVEPGKPADQAGVKVGDTLVSLDGQPVKGLQDMIKILQDSKDKTMNLTILRDGKEQTLPITPQLLDAPKSAGRTYRVGIGAMQVEQLPLGEAIPAAIAYCRDNSLLIFKLLGNLVHRPDDTIKQFSGPVGIMMASGDAASEGFSSLMELMAIISLNLAIFNLFPIPILDGGLMLMLLIEGIMRRDISQTIKERVYQAAFVFLLLFAALVIYNDVAKSFHM